MEGGTTRGEYSKDGEVSGAQSERRAELWLFLHKVDITSDLSRSSFPGGPVASCPSEYVECVSEETVGKLPCEMSV